MNRKTTSGHTQSHLTSGPWGYHLLRSQREATLTRQRPTRTSLRNYKQSCMVTRRRCLTYTPKSRRTSLRTAWRRSLRGEQHTLSCCSIRSFSKMWSEETRWTWPAGWKEQQSGKKNRQQRREGAVMRRKQCPCARPLHSRLPVHRHRDISCGICNERESNLHQHCSTMIIRGTGKDVQPQVPVCPPVKRVRQRNAWQAPSSRCDSLIQAAGDLSSFHYDAHVLALRLLHMLSASRFTK